MSTTMRTMIRPNPRLPFDPSSLGKLNARGILNCSTNSRKYITQQLQWYNGYTFLCPPEENATKAQTLNEGPMTPDIHDLDDDGVKKFWSVLISKQYQQNEAYILMLHRQFQNFFFSSETHFWRMMAQSTVLCAIWQNWCSCSINA